MLVTDEILLLLNDSHSIRTPWHDESLKADQISQSEENISDLKYGVSFVSSKSSLCSS